MPDTQTCARPGCNQLVYRWLHPHYCSRTCELITTPLDIAVTYPALAGARHAPDDIAATADAGGWVARAIERLRATLVTVREMPPAADTSTEDCTDPRCTQIDGRCVGMHCAACGDPCGPQGHSHCEPA